MLTEEQKNRLLKVARQAIEANLDGKRVLQAKGEMRGEEGAFVSVYKNGELRGCIGQIVSEENSLFDLIQKMAIEASSHDPRFLPVDESELEEIKIEISVLSVPKKIDNWQELELGKHGVIVKKGFQSGVFLPQVAIETGWSKEEFLSQLCASKAGLDPSAFKNDPEVEIEVFEAEVFSE